MFESKIEKIKKLMKDLSDEELTELKNLLGGTEEDAEAPTEESVEEVKTETETPGEDGAVETEDEVKTEEETPVATEETETPEEAPVEDAPAEETETTEEQPDEESQEAANQDFAEVISAQNQKIDALTEMFNNLTAKVEPILQRFADVDGKVESAGLGKTENSAEDEDENLSAYERALKVAKY